MPLHLLTRKMERETPSIREHSKGRKAAGVSTGFVVTHFHLIVCVCFFLISLGFSSWARLWAPTWSSGDLNLSVNDSFSDGLMPSEGGILVIGNLRLASVFFCEPLCRTYADI